MARASGELVYDWNRSSRTEQVIRGPIELLDETFRDGLQNPSATHPRLEDKLRILHLMDAIGIDYVAIGIPASSERAFQDCLALCREIASARLKLSVVCAGRTVKSDILPIIELSQKTGVRINVYAFVGSSPIRALAESWDLARIKALSAEAVDVAVHAGLRTTYVTEDTTRSRPEVLAELFKLAIDHGATRLCLCDTVGHATPEGTRNLVRFARSLVASMGADVGLDWHGHNDRGLALINALCAIEEGADRVHGTALGIGERAGNAATELILLNLRLMGLMTDKDTTHLIEYCRRVAEALGWSIPINYPVIGRDAFRTATGVHAAAIAKAQAKGDAWLADRVYSGVPAGMFGRSQEICVGAMSGSSNVVYWLTQRGVPAEPALVSVILAHAKRSDRILRDEEILEIVRAHSEQSHAYLDEPG